MLRLTNRTATATMHVYVLCMYMYVYHVPCTMYVEVENITVAFR